MLRSLMAKVMFVLMQTPIALSATTTSSKVDTLGFGSLAIQFVIGAFAFDTTNMLALKLQHSDDDITYVDCVEADYAAVEVAGVAIFKNLNSTIEQNAVFTADYVGSKRYVKAVATETGTVTLAGYAVVAALGHPQAMPVIRP